MDEQKKQNRLFYAFCLSLCFLGIYMAVVWLLAEPIGSLLSSMSSGWMNFFHTILLALISIAVSALFCPLIRNDLILFPFAWTFFIVYTLIGYLFCLTSSAISDRGLACRVMALYMTAPTILGPAISWSIYLLRNRRRSSVTSGRHPGRC